MSLGDRMREARNKRKLTQEQLAANIGVSKNAVSNYENGVSFPKSIDIFIGIINTLQVDANYLLQDEMAQAQINSDYIENNTIKKPPDAQSIEGDIRKTRLLHNYHKLNSDGQDKLVDYSDVLSGNPKFTSDADGEKKAGA